MFVLASDLCGWSLNIMTEEEAAEKLEAESSKFISEFMEALSVDEDVAAVLVEEGHHVRRNCLRAVGRSHGYRRFRRRNRD